MNSKKNYYNNPRGFQKKFHQNLYDNKKLLNTNKPPSMISELNIINGLVSPAILHQGYPANIAQMIVFSGIVPIRMKTKSFKLFS